MPLFGSIQRRLSALRQEFRRVFAREPTAPPPRELDLRFLEDRILYSASPLAAELLAGQSSGLEGQDVFVESTVVVADPNSGSTTSPNDPTGTQLSSIEQIEMDLRDLDTLLAQLHALEEQPSSESDAISVDASLAGDSHPELFEGVSDGADEEVWTLQQTSSSRSHELLVIDISLPDYEQLISGWRLDQDANSEFSVLLVDRSVDGVQFVSDYLAASDTRFDTIHLVTHGFAGGFDLGSTSLNTGNLEQYATQFDIWRSSLTDDADLLLYGCSIANGTSGSTFLSELANLLSVDIAASIDVTGASALGGDWDLEYRIGSIDAQLFADRGQLDSYMRLLATGTASADLLTGSNVTETHDGLAGNDVLIGGTNVASDGQFLQAANPGLYATYSAGSSFGGWTVTAGSVDLIGTGWQSSPTGGRSIDLDGSSPGTISQTLNTVAGNTYQVRFLMSANGMGTVTKAMEVSAAGVTQSFGITTASTHSGTNMDWQERFFSFTATGGSTTLQFKSLSASSVSGAVLADVVVADMTTNNGNDTLDGGAGADTIIGGGGNDIINGGSENDWIRGGRGNETIDGGTGTDILVFSGSRSDYQVSLSGSTYTITDLRGGSPDGTDTITNIETFRFLDQDYTTANVTLNTPIVETFENGSLTGWTGGAIVSSNADYGSFLTSAASFNNQSSTPGTLGISGAQDVFKTFSLSGNQTSVTLSFNFHRLDTWDNESFNVYLNDTIQSARLFSQYSVQSYSDSTPDHASGANLGLGGGDDVTYTYVITFATTGSSLKLGFGSELNEVWSNEAWGVDNIVIREQNSAISTTYSEGTTSADIYAGGMVGAWRGDGNANDQLGQNNGSPVWGATYATGRSGQAFSFDGVDDYVQIGSSSTFQMTNAFTAEAWVNPTGNGSGHSIIFNKEGEYELARESTSGRLMWAIANTSNTWSWVDTGYVLPLNTWTHLAWTFENGTVRTFANGSEVHVGAISSLTIGDHDTSRNDLRIGGRQTYASGQNFQGLIDEVGIYNRALTASQIAAIVAANGADKGLSSPLDLSNDSYAGGTGNDSIALGAGNDYATGGDGNDLIDTGAGADFLSGGWGNDTLVGGTGADTIDGGAGDDTIWGEGSNLVTDGSFESALSTGWTASGNVQATTSQGSVLGMVAVAFGGGNTANTGTITQSIGTANGSTYTLGFDYWAVGIAGISQSMRVQVISGGMTVMDQSISATTPGSGFDIQDFEWQFTALGANTTVIFSDASTVTNDVDGMLDNIRLFLDNRSNDIIAGGSGNDLIYGGGGDDWIHGGAGSDVIFGGSGSDTVSYYGSTAAVSINLATRTYLGGDAATDVLYSIENIVGSAGNDTLTGNTGDNVIEGGLGNDTINGGAGIDTAVYRGNWSDYSISYNSATQSYTVRDHRASSTDGADTLTGIEYLRFADRTVSASPYFNLNTTYLSDLTPTVAWNGTYLRNDLGEGNGTLQNDGVLFSKGLLTHPGTDNVTSTVSYAIGGATSFKAILGIDESAWNPNPSNGVRYYVLLDGVQVYDSGVVTASTAPISLNLDTTGRSIITLGVNPLSSISCDHAAWYNARLETQPVPSSFSVTEDVAGNLIFSGSPFGNTPGTALTVTLSIADGTITGNAGTGVTVGGTATARTFSGTVANLNSYFTTAGRISYTGALNNTDSRALTISVTDGSNSTSATSLVNITSVNDAPVFGNVIVDNTTFGGQSTVSYTGRVDYIADRYVPVDTSGTYVVQVTANSSSTSALHFAGYNSATIEGYRIGYENYLVAWGSVDTTLAQALNPGDTQIVLTDASTWYRGATAHARNLIWGGYTDSRGVLQDLAYSANGSFNFYNGVWAENGINGNVITLQSPWSGPALDVGATVRNICYGMHFQYNVLCSQAVTGSNAVYSGTVAGISSSGSFTSFRPGTEFINGIILSNYYNGTGVTTTWSNMTIQAVDTKLAVVENWGAGSFVGRVLGSDPDAGNTLTYSLVDNAGGRFQIDSSTGTITVAANNVLNFEANPSHNITVRITDNSGAFTDRTYSLQVKDINESPTQIGTVSGTNLVSNNSLETNTTGWTLSGNVERTSNVGSDGTFALGFSRSNTANTGVATTTIATTVGETYQVGFDLGAQGNNIGLQRSQLLKAEAIGSTTLATQYSYDFSTTTATFARKYFTFVADSTTTTLRFSDVSTITTSVDMYLDQIDVRRVETTAPSLSVAENSANGTVVGTAAGIDREQWASLTYSLVDNAGGRFAINSTSGQVTVANGSLLNFEAAASHTIIVRATDQGGLTFDRTLTVNLTNIPNTLTVSTTADNNDAGIGLGNALHTIEWLNVNRGTDGLISLREAIIAANNTANAVDPDLISFSLSTDDPNWQKNEHGQWLIQLTAALPTITDPVILDATTQWSYFGTPVIELAGHNAGAGVHGLNITGGSSTVRGLAINGFSGDGIRIENGGGNTIEGNLIGLRPTSDGTTAGVFGDAVVWWRGDNSGLDSVGTNHGTSTNGATYSTGMVGSAFDFDGVNDYISVPDSTAWDLGNKDFSIATWIKFDAVTNAMIIHQENGGPTGGFEWDYQVASQRLIFSPEGHTVTIGSNWTPIAGQWYHLAITRTDNVFRQFVNGAQIGSSASSAVTIPNVSGQLWIGSYVGAGYSLDGQIDELAIFRRGLSTSEITSLYDAGLAGKSPVLTSQVAYLAGEGSTTDARGISNFSLQGNTTYTAGKVGSAFEFDGVGDGLTATNPSVLDSRQLTYVTWFNLADTSVYPNLMGRQFSNGLGWTMHIVPDGRLVMRIDTDAALGQGLYSSVSGLDNGQWHMAVMTLNLDTNQVQLSVNGNGLSSWTYSGTFGNATGGSMKIASGIVGAHDFNGKLDEIQVFNRQLTNAEISQLYASGLRGSNVGNQNGISIVNSDGNTIGGVTAADRNVISGNTDSGVVISGAASQSNTVSGNYIGTDWTGTKAAGNGTHGITLSGVGSNTIGGSVAGAGNLISGNIGSGVHITGNGAETGMVGWWKGDNSTADAFNQNNATLVNGATYGTGVTNAPNSAFSFNGNMQFASIATAESLDLTSAMSVEAWINPSTLSHYSNYNTIVAKDYVNPRNFYLGLRNDGRLHFFYRNGSGINVGFNDAGTPIATNQWTHVAGVIDTVAGYVKLFVNGIEIATTASNGAMITNSAPVTIGAYGGGASSFHGRIDEVGLYNRALAAAEIADIHRAAGHGKAGNTVQGNRIGFAATSNTPLGNGGGGVYLASANNIIGGTSAGAGNIIANNSGNGVTVAGNAVSNVGNSILGNSISSNTGLGIDLGNDGITSNDGLKTAGQPNLLMDRPVISTGNLVGNNLTLSGYVGSAASQSLFAGSRVEFFLSSTSGTGGSGQVYLGSLTTDSAGNFSGTLNVTGLGVISTDNLTATATDSGGNTSEFSATFGVNVAPTDVTVARYLSTMTPTATSNIHNGLQNDQNYWTPVLNIGGVTYARGLGMHAPGVGVGSADYAIDGATSFKATIGLNSGALISGSVVFRVYVDGVLRFTSPTVGVNTMPIDIDVNTTGGATLRLEVDPVDGNGSDHSVWANARLEGAAIGLVIPENSANGSTIGSVNRIDVDWGDNATYSLVDNAGGRFAIASGTGLITVANSSLLNYEASTSHTIVVRATDVGGLYVDRTLTVTVTNVNDSPRLYGARMVDNFDDGALDGWAPISLGGVTNWAANLGTAQNTSSTGNGFLGRTVAGMQHETAYTISADISWAYNSGGSHNNGVGFVFGYQNDSNYWIARWTDPGSAYSSYGSHRDLQLIEVVNGQSHIRGVADQLSLAASFQMELRATANELSVLIDGVARLTVATPPPALRTFGLYSSDNDHGVRYDNVILETPLASTVQFQEGGAPVILDSDAVVLDPELSSSNFSGATLNLSRNGGANSQDLFSATGTLGALTESGNLTVDGTTIGTVTTNSGGTLVLTFNGSATNALVNSAMQQIAYANSSDAPPSNVQINWTFSDGNSGAQGTGGALTATGNVVVNITAVNDAPTLNTVTTGLAGWWKMDESSGTTTVDASGNENNGTLINGAAWQTGQMGNAIEFDGTNDYINISASNVGTFGTGDFAITFWINADKFTSAVGDYITPLNQGLVGPYAGYAPNWYVLLGQHTGTDGLRFGRHGVNQYDFSAGSFNPGQWYHMAIVRSSGTIAMYVDGVSRSVSSIGGGVGSYDFNAGSPIQIGAGFGSGAFVDGKMDDVRIYKRALSAGEVNAIASGLTTLTSINEDSTNSAGNTIAQIITDGAITDVDYTPSTSAPEAIAITAINNTNGAWQFKLGSGSWSNIDSTLLATQALLLDSSDSVRFVPNADWSGDDTFTYRAWDKTGGTNAGSYVTIGSTGGSTPYSTEIGTAQITVSAVNDAPIAVADTATAIEASGISNGTAGTNPTGNVLTNDTDIDAGDTKTVNGVAAGVVGSASTNVGSAVMGTYGSINIAANGSYTYTVDNTNTAVQALRTSGNTLTDVFTYTMRDAAGLTSTTQITVTIQGANDAPNEITGTLTIAENSANGSVAGTVTGQDVDTGDSFTYSLTDTAGGRFAINSSTGQVTVANGSLIDFETNASHTITVRVTDAAGATFDKVLTVSVTNTNDAPVFSSWTPAQITTSLWLDAADASTITLNGSTVSQWRDKSGNGRNVAQVAASAQPTYSLSGLNGKPVLSFDGLNDTLDFQTAFGTVTAFNAIAVWRSNANYDFDYLYQLGTGTGSGLSLSTSGPNSGIWNGNYYGWYSTNNAYSFSTPAVLNASVLTSHSIGNVTPTNSLWVNGTQRTVTAWPQALNFDSSSSNLGRWTYFGTDYHHLNGYIAELVFVVNSNLSAADRQRLEGYLASKWGLAASLPADHPWKNGLGGSLTAINEDETISAGNTVAQVVPDGAITDADYTPSTSAPEAIAITAIDNTNGTWQFKLGSGAWSNINATLLATQALLLDSTDSVRFVPNADWSGNSTFTYRAWDKTGGTTAGSYVTISSTGGSTPYSTETGTALITVSAVNDAPIAVADTATAIEAGGISNGTAGTNPTGNVLTNDTDVDAGDTKTVSGVAAGVVGSASTNVGSAVTGTYGSINIAANGAYTYTDDNSNAAVQALRTSAQTLTDVFTYTMRDTAGLTSTTQITVTIQGANDAPVGVNDAATAVEAGGVSNGTAGTNPTGNVLTNDTDVDAGDTKAVTAVVAGSQASATGGVASAVTGTYGSINIAADGSYTYTVDNTNAAVQALRTSSNTLQDVFTYKVADTAGLTSLATITVTIQGANDAPSALDDSFTTNEDTAITFDVRTNDSDVDSATLSVTQINGTAISVGGSVAVTGGSVTLNANGSLTFTPTANYNGSPSFTYSLSDGSLTATATVSGTVTAVNDEPTLTATGTNPTFTEDGTAADLFNTVTASTVETGQNLTRIDFTVSNVTDGSAERIIVDGTTIALVNGGSGTTATNGMTYTVSVVSGTATVSLSHGSGITTAQMQTLVDGMAYQNTSQAPTAANRVVTLTRLDDSGSNSAPNDNTATLALASTVTVVAVDDAPVFSNLDNTPTFIENGSPVVLDSNVTITDAELTAADNFSGATLTLVRIGGTSSQDLFSATGTLGALTQGGNLTVGGIAIGSVTTNSGGMLVLTFNSSATNAMVNSAMQQIAYANSSEAPPASVQISWTFTTAGSIRFTDVTAIAAVGDTSSSRDADWGDIDGDGDLDLYVTNWGANVLYRNNGNGTFTNITTTAGVGDAGAGIGGSWGDYDGDGDLDMYIANYGGGNILYRNNGNGTFTDVTATAGVASFSIAHEGSWGDYDRDGDLDLYVTNYYTNMLYRNNGNGTFTDVTATAGVGDPGFGRDGSWGDYDGDGDLDLYVTNEQADVLYRNNGNGTFTDVTAAAGVGDLGYGLDAEWGDYDLDGDLDLYITGSTANVLYRNEGNGTFTNVTTLAGVDTRGYDGAWGDADGDGDLDLYVSNWGQANVLYRNNGDGTFTDITYTAGVGALGDLRSAWGDYDRDGDLDLYVTNYGANVLYRNDTLAAAARSATGQVIVTITGVNDTPVAANDTFTTSEDSAVTFDVRTNDGDVDSATLSVTQINGTAISVGGSVAVTGGSVALNANGSLTFTPTANYNGSPSFTYTLSDGSLTATATVNGTVAAVNDAPLLNSDVTSGLVGRWTLNQSSGATAPDSSVSGRNATLFNMEDTDWVAGRLSNGLQFDGTNEYASFADAGLPSGSAARTMAGWVKTSMTTEGYLVSYGTFGAGQMFALGLFGSRAVFTQHGDAIFGTTTIADGHWHHLAVTHDGTTTRLYVDGILEGTRTLNVQTVLSAGNIGGLIGGGGKRIDGLGDDVRIYDRALSATEVAAIVVATTPAISINEDVTNSAGNTIAQIVSDGSITDADYSPISSAPEAIAITAIDNTNGTWQYKIGGVWANIDSAQIATQALLLDNVDSIRFVPSADWNGNATFSYRAWDKTGGTTAGNYVTISSTGGSTPYSSEIVTAQITVNAVNDTPVAAADAATAIEAGGISNGTAGTNPTGNVLANDTDVDAGDTKTVSGVAAGVVGSASTNVGSAVTGTYGSITIAANGSYTYTVDNNNATVQALRTSGNTLQDVFTYTMRDTAGLTSTTQITVTIQGANDAPSDLLGTLTVAENAANGTSVGTITRTDVDSGDGATYSLVDNAGGRFAIDASTGVVTVANSTLLNYEAATSHNITVRVTDTAGATFDKVINVTLTDVNEFNVGTITDLDWNDNGVPENSVGGTTVGIIARASDPDGTQNAVTYSLLDSADGRFAIDPVTGVVTVAENSVLDYESITSHSIVVVANSSDGSESTGTFTILVLPVNERPIAFSEQYQTDFVTPITISAAELLFNDFDEDGDTLQIVLLAPPDRGTLTMIPGGGFTYRPEVNFVGIATIQYAVFDGQFLSDPQTIELLITPPGNTVVSPPDRPDPPGVTNELPSVDDDQRITDPTDLVTVSPEPTPSPAPPPALNPVPVPIIDHPQSRTDEASPPKELLPEPLGVVRNDERANGRTDSLQLVEAIDLILSGLAARSMQGVGPSIQRLELEKLQGDVLQLENQNFQLFVSQHQRQVLETLKQENFVRTSTPIVVGTAIGAGISIHVLMSAHFGSTLLSQSGVFMPLDPLTILEGSAKVKKSKAREDLLFEGVAINDHASK